MNFLKDFFNIINFYAKFYSKIWILYEFKRNQNWVNLFGNLNLYTSMILNINSSGWQPWLLITTIFLRGLMTTIMFTQIAKNIFKI